MTTREAAARKADYVLRVTRGEGFMPWQPRAPIAAVERRFRAAIERRKDELLAGRSPIFHPVLLTDKKLAQARKHLAGGAPWAGKWWRGVRQLTDHLVRQPASYVAEMIGELTPTNPYTFTCPNCVGRQSQEGYGISLCEWRYRRPHELRCRACGQVLPDPRFRETGQLVCPRRNQTFTYFLNDAERAAPENRSGDLAWKWVGQPVHVSFSGLLRFHQVSFMLRALRPLALAFRLTGDAAPGQLAVRIFQRLAECYPKWLYHDFYDTVADCDPLYAAWHDLALPLEWKRHPCARAYGGSTYETGPVDDTLTAAKMLATFFGGGRLHPSVDAITTLAPVTEAWDLLVTATDAAGRPLVDAATRQTVERDFLLEWLLGPERWLTTPQRLCNKAPYAYVAYAVAGKGLGLPAYCAQARAGYEAIRDHAFAADGFSGESPAYNSMFLDNLVWVTEALYGADDDGYAQDPKLRLMMRAALEALASDGHYLPLSDSPVGSSFCRHFAEIGARRLPEHFGGTLPALALGRPPTEYALLNLDARALRRDTGLNLPERLFPVWQTAILRHGQGRRSSVLALSFSPAGGHRHTDNLGLYYADRGRPILGDQGYVCDTPMLGWLHSTHSHNLVVVDDQDQWFWPGDQGPGRQPSLRYCVFGPHLSVVEAESACYGQCSEYRRLIVLLKGPDGATLAVDVFRVCGGRKHAWRVFSELASSDARDGALVFTGLTMPPAAPLPNYGQSIAPEHVFGLRDARTVANPPASWQAQWRQPGASYRLHVLCPVQTVSAAHGPGQETYAQGCRRVRYLDLINESSGASPLRSTFVVVHEPSGRQGRPVVRAAERLPVPPEAGPDAVAIRLLTRWGTYLILSDFAAEAEVVGARFQGNFACLGETSEGGRWTLTCGATTCFGHGAGFVNAPAWWAGPIADHSAETLTAATDPPARWPAPMRGVTTHVLVGDGQQWTGFPVAKVQGRQLSLTRFPFTGAKAFRLPAVRCRTRQPR